MVPVLNHPFLEHTIAYLKKYQVEKVVLATSYLSEIIQEYFSQGASQDVKLIYALEDEPLGTAGAVKNAEQHISDTFCVLNGDIFTDLDLANMFAFHREKGAKVTISLTWVDNPCAYGVVEAEGDGRITRFIEKPSPNHITTNWINAGIYIIEPEALKYIPHNTHYMFENGLFPLLLKLGEPLYGYPYHSYWLDMGTMDKYLQLNYDLLLSKVESALLSTIGKNGVYYGKRCVIHPSAQIIGPAVIGNNCNISQGVRIKGPVVIGSDCSLEEYAIIEATVLWQGVSIGKHAVVEHAVIGNDTNINAYVRFTYCVAAGGNIQTM